ncbi:MAG: RluA family pseudouridine synthase [Deltaproteobacteria bacterium]|nr:RluA family pseudouridine synthase [Deltaproteobacteria bacterium]
MIAQASDAGSRLDQVLTRRLTGRSRALIQKHIEAGAVFVNGARPKQGSKTKVRTGDRIDYVPPAPPPSNVTAEDIPLRILLEDDEILVLDKPKNLIVHPSSTRREGTLVAAVLHHLKREASANPRAGIVHRLDKDTTGVMIVAKTPFAEDKLAAAFRNRAVEKAYVAVVHGRPAPDDGTIETLFGRHPRARKRFSSRVEAGKVAITHYATAERFIGASLMHIRLETGRTHQIRVHFSDRGHPLIGDPVYGRRRRSQDPRVGAILNAFDRPALHARQLVFPHPSTGKSITVEAPLPSDLCTLIDQLRAWPALTP